MQKCGLVGLVGLVAVIFLVGCSSLGAEGSPGFPGELGPSGPQGAAGQDGFGLRWEDATGTLIPGVFGGLTPFPNYADLDGHIWTVTSETMAIDASASGLVLFPSTDCTGEEHYQVSSIPRIATQMNDGTFRVRLDNPGPLVQFGAGALAQYSINNGGTCSVNTAPRLAATEAASVQVTKPTIAGTGPLHPVLVTGP